MEDSEIISLFFERSEEAIIELSEKYGKLCLRISQNIVNDFHDAEECVNESYLAVWDTVPPNRPDSLSAYVCRITRNISVDRYRHNTADRRDSSCDLCLDELENSLFASTSIDPDLNDDALADVIDEFLSRLSRTDRTILMRRYWYMDPYEDIARASGISEGAVRTRASRVREKLRKHLKKRGVLK